MSKITMALLLEDVLREVDWKGALSKVKGLVTGKGGQGPGQTKILAREEWQEIAREHPAIYRTALNTPFDQSSDQKQMQSFAVALDNLFTAAANNEKIKKLHQFLMATLAQAKKDVDPSMKASRLSVVRNKYLDIKNDLELARTQEVGTTKRESDEVSLIAHHITEDLDFNNGLVLEE